MLRSRRWLIYLALLGLSLLGAGGGWLLALWFGMPDIATAQKASAIESTKIYDRNGILLYEVLHPEGGSATFVPLSHIPQALQEATIATEDARFYSHPGVDFRAIVRATLQNLRHRRVVSGASTIPQQVVRMLMFEPEERRGRSPFRKLKEAVWAIRLSRKLSKEQVFELYLNRAYYGNLAWGVGAASLAYFGKPVGELDLAECALLAGLPQAPAHYDPGRDFAAAQARQETVLKLMVRSSFISPEEAELATREELSFRGARFPIRAPHFVMYVREELEARYGEEAISRGGLRVYTTLDSELNELAEGIIRRKLAELNAEVPALPRRVGNAALVALDPRSSQILAMVGSPDYFDASIKGAVNASLALRQPGSSIKPVTYAAAFSRGDFTAATVLYDVPSSFVTQEGEAFQPVNYDRAFHGPLTLRQALATSSNVAAAKLLDKIGLEAMLGMAKALGITTLADEARYGLAVTLGGGEVKLLELTQAYSVFAAGGVRHTPVAILRVEDARGNTLEEWKPSPGERALSPQVAYLVAHILSDEQARIPAFGEGSALKLSRPAVAKTGTTGDWRDNWTVGYTPELAAGVWVGNADNSPMPGLSGVDGAAPIWHDFMEEALKGIPPRDFPQPEGMVWAEVCPESGRLPSAHCPHLRRELFISGTEPQEECDLHRLVLVHRPTGLLAGEGCPPEDVEARTFALLPAEAKGWAGDAGYPQPPTEYAPCARGGVATAIEGWVVRSPGIARAEIAILNPASRSTFALTRLAPASSQRIEVSAGVLSQGEAEMVEIWVDGSLWREWKVPPFQDFWELEPGEHTFIGILVDRAGRRFASDPVQITVWEGEKVRAAVNLPQK